MIYITEHLQLHLVDDRHVADLYSLASENREYLGKWLPWVNMMHSSEFIQNFVSRSKKQAEQGTDFAYVIVRNNVIVGRIGIHNIDRQNNICAIGYWIGEEYEGAGIVTQACVGLVAYCFTDMKINRIEIRCGVGNTRSRGVPDRLGFELEGVAREAEVVNGEYIDLYCFSMLKRDWLKKQV